MNASICSHVSQSEGYLIELYTVFVYTISFVLLYVFFCIVLQLYTYLAVRLLAACMSN